VWPARGGPAAGAATLIQARLRGARTRALAAAEAEVSELEQSAAAIELQLFFLRDQANQITARMAGAAGEPEGSAAAGEGEEAVYEPF